ncbi:alpha-L-fucosidase [Dinghuibacter silviterrae]|uniref:alpha-L-fucosidase n=1 Tax=Dinghuibacter silviterrae TaxID=1539049 RepID=A0A4R8DTS5_9BACT|nr:alpha-L-fucosidase [Dinghuibacter silviterrae]TDX01732.1 alpha-L-fucosidase [Dinghuibacter silviterrae]
MRKIAVLLLFVASAAHAQYTPAPENLAARRWFDSARFGMFIHWGAFSVLGDGEWVMNNRNIKVQDYQRLQQIFNPTAFDAHAWVSIAKAAGMQYITLITRHHDGFSDWDTKASDWKITNTPWGKDAVKMIADECHKQGIKLFVYYSLLDWTRSDYPYETGRTGKGTGRTAKSDYAHYLQFMKDQLTELLTNYGEIAGVWFDGYWDQTAPEGAADRTPRIDWKLDEIYALIHKLQPQALIGNNHHLSPFPGEDFQMFEQDLPGENKSGLDFQPISRLPLESCVTMNDSWGFNITDEHYKSPKELITLLVRAAGYGANLLLNIGPLPNGVIQPEFQERLQGMGDWLKTYGGTIYGTRGGFLRPQDWGAVTQKGNHVFVHLLHVSGDTLSLPFPYKVRSAKAFASGAPVTYSVKDGRLLLRTEALDLQALDAVVDVEIRAN